MTDSNPLDDLIMMDPLNLTKENLDNYIAQLRKQLARWEAGGRPVKEKPQVDTSGLDKAFIPEVPKLRRI